MGIFSSNDTLDDISSGDLKYFMVPYFIGDLTIQLPHESPGERLQLVRAARFRHQAFLTTCEQHGLVKKSLMQAIKQDALNEPAARRAAKVARFKREKEIRTRLDEIERRKSTLERARGPGADTGGADGGDFEELERETWLLMIESAAQKAVDNLDLLRDEMQLLVETLKMQGEDGGKRLQEIRDAQIAAEQRHREAANAARLANAPTIRGIEDERRRLQEGVFKPSHVMHTMSVEQWGEEEMRREKVRLDAAAAAGAPPPTNPMGEIESSSSEEEEEGEEDEEKLRRARAMDDWKDEHKRGWGNSKLKPLGR
eukprot:jgi/Mesvir1/18754/Mv01260-RA.1